MSTRFYSAAPITADRAALDGTEAHHLLHVMRAAVGDHVTLFDNSGAEFPAVIEKLGRTTVELRVIERLEVNRELNFPLTVGVALPKGDRQKWLVEKLTELNPPTPPWNACSAPSSKRVNNAAATASCKSPNRNHGTNGFSAIRRARPHINPQSEIRNPQFPCVVSSPIPTAPPSPPST